MEENEEGMGGWRRVGEKYVSECETDERGLCVLGSAVD